MLSAHWIVLNIRIFFPCLSFLFLFLSRCILHVCSWGPSLVCLLKEMHILMLESTLNGIFSILSILANNNFSNLFDLYHSCKVYSPLFSGICHSMLSAVTYQDRLAHWQTFTICKSDLLVGAISCILMHNLFEYMFSCICSYLHHNEFTGSVILLAGLPLSSL